MEDMESNGEDTWDWGQMLEYEHAILDFLIQFALFISYFLSDVKLLFPPRSMHRDLLCIRCGSTTCLI